MAPVDRQLRVDKSHVFNGDSFELVKLLQDASVDLFISSPPYNIGKAYERGLFENFDQYVSLLTGLCQDLEKNSKRQEVSAGKWGITFATGKSFPSTMCFMRYSRSLASY